MDPVLVAVFNEALSKLWKLADDASSPLSAKDKEVASVVGDMLEDIAHCGHTVEEIKADDLELVYMVAAPPDRK